MKLKLLSVLGIQFLAIDLIQGQGTFIYDQQSSTNSGSAAGGPIIQQIATPYGQSFTPALSSIGFVQLGLFDSNPGNNQGATVFVNLRANSIDGISLGSTAPVFMPDGFGNVTSGATNFFFATAISLTPGQVYYLQPIVQSGDLWGVSAGEYYYPGGSVFVGGFAATASDYWFREGIVPEPSAALLFLFGGGVVAWRHRQKRRSG
jgi:PEP-CTERM motif